MCVRLCIELRRQLLTAGCVIYVIKHRTGKSRRQGNCICL